MAYEDLLLKWIPKEVQEGPKKLEFGMLLSFVRENKIKNTTQLKKLLEDQIETCRSWLNKSMTASTMSRIRRECVRKLQHFTQMKEIIDKHLKRR